MMRGLVRVLVLLVVLVLMIVPNVFMLHEQEQAIITQLGAYVRTVTTPGLHLKLPLIQTIHRLDKRVLTTDAQPTDYLTLDKKRMSVDYVAHWYISNPLAFFMSVATVEGAKARIEDIVFSELRRELASREFAAITSELREPTMEAVANAARQRTADFGIELIDVRIKHADLPREVQQSVFARMVAERDRIAKRYRSEGEEEAAKIRAETDKQRDILLAQAYDRSQRLRGEGDALATAIYANAYSQDPNFYVFVRTLEAYDDMLTSETLLMLSGETSVFQLLSTPPAGVDPEKHR